MQPLPNWASPETNEEFRVSIKAQEIDLGVNVGKWTARFTIRKHGKDLYYGAITTPTDSEAEAERAAAGEACRILSNGARLLY